jgi:hypothetical protein
MEEPSRLEQQIVKCLIDSKCFVISNSVYCFCGTLPSATTKTDGASSLLTVQV